MIRCRVCHSPSTFFIFNSPDTHGRHPLSQRQFPLYCCSTCGAYFLNNLSPNSYPPNYYHHSVPVFIQKILNFISDQKNRPIYQYFHGRFPVRLLDVGAGEGDFLLSLPSKKFISTGIDINSGATNIAQNKGLKVICGNIDYHSFGSQKFDCITLWHVLEHLPHPQATLRRLRHLLSPDGLLVVTTPNTQSFGFRLGQKNFFHLDSPRHLSLLNPQSLNHLLISSGFSTWKIQNNFYEYPLDLFWSLRRSPWRFLIYPTYPIIKLVDPETILALATAATSPKVP